MAFPVHISGQKIEIWIFEGLWGVSKNMDSAQKVKIAVEELLFRSF